MGILNRNRERLAQEIVAEAKRHVGYRAQPDRKSAFQLKHYLGKPWNGTFIDRVLHDALGDFAEVRFLSTVTALSYFVKRNRVYQKPRLGDIAFFNFATDPQNMFEQPHVGVVIAVEPNGSIRTVEGETSPGTPQGSQLADGVFERVRWPAEVLGYVRPAEVKRYRRDGERPKLKLSYFTSNPKTRAKAVETVQRALNRLYPDWSFIQGKKNREFTTRFGLFSRENGVVENRGELHYLPLTMLADRTGEFEVDS